MAYHYSSSYLEQLFSSPLRAIDCLFFTSFPHLLSCLLSFVKSSYIKPSLHFSASFLWVYKFLCIFFVLSLIVLCPPATIWTSYSVIMLHSSHPGTLLNHHPEIFLSSFLCWTSHFLGFTFCWSTSCSSFLRKRRLEVNHFYFLLVWNLVLDWQLYVVIKF